jgi:Omp85 superfamily domain
VGDLPPYEAFPIGGTNSVRGYSEGGVGSGRNYGAGTAELHFPLFKPLQVLPELATPCTVRPTAPCMCLCMLRICHSDRQLT